MGELNCAYSLFILIVHRKLCVPEFQYCSSNDLETNFASFKLVLD